MEVKTGTFGNVSYEGNSITIEALPNTLGDVAITTGDGRIECYWDGNEWVCNSISFGQNQSQAATSV